VQFAEDSQAVNVVAQRVKMGFQVLDLDGTIFLKIRAAASYTDIITGCVYNRVHIMNRA